MVHRHLPGQRKLTRECLARLREEESIDPEEEQEKKEEQELAIEAPIRLNDVRLQQVLSELKASGAKRILDLGCRTPEGQAVRRDCRNGRFLPHTRNRQRPIALGHLAFETQKKESSSFRV